MRRALVVEDDPDIVELLVHYLSGEGLAVESAGNRRAALESVWGYSYSEAARTVDVHVSRLHERLPGLAPAIRTVRPLGYRLAQESE